MLGKRPNQRGLFEVDNLYRDYIGTDNFYAYLASQRGKLFRDEDFADLYCPDNGRRGVPPGMLATALILQTYDRVSDEEAKRRADYDMQWKFALGVELTERPFAKSTLQLFRAQLVLHDKARAMFIGSIELAKSEGFLKHRKKLRQAIDTTAILGRGAVKDTYNLLADGIVQLVQVLAEQADATPESWAGERGLERYFGSSIKGDAEIDWHDDQSRKAFLASIVEDADRLLELARDARSRHEADSDQAKQIEQAAALLLQLLVQDIERGPDGPSIIKGVAKDRVVSVHDPEMRHGRKSSRGRFDGHKGAFGVDTDSQLISAVGLLPGNSHDSKGALELTEQSEENTGMQVGDTVGDCAYGTGEVRREFAEADREIIAPVPAPPATGKFPKTSFTISHDEDSVTCPAGCTTRRFKRVPSPPKANGRRYRVKRFAFPQSECATCSMRADCLKGKGARTITLHPQEAMMRQAREFQETEAFREAKRRRQTVEHRIARLRQLGVGQARYFGWAKTLFQLLIAATVANLTLIAAAARV